MARGAFSLAVTPKPSTDAAVPSPAMVVTVRDMASTNLILLFCQSATKMELSMGRDTIAFGTLNAAKIPTPSENPHVPLPTKGKTEPEIKFTETILQPEEYKM